MLNQARLKVLKARDDHVGSVLDDAKKQLVKITKDQSKYSKLIEGLIAQVRLDLTLSVSRYHVTIKNYNLCFSRASASCSRATSPCAAARRTRALLRAPSPPPSPPSRTRSRGTSTSSWTRRTSSRLTGEIIVGLLLVQS